MKRSGSRLIAKESQTHSTCEHHVIHRIGFIGQNLTNQEAAEHAWYPEFSSPQIGLQGKGTTPLMLCICIGTAKNVIGTAKDTQLICIVYRLPCNTGSFLLQKVSVLESSFWSSSANIHQFLNWVNSASLSYQNRRRNEFRGPSGCLSLASEEAISKSWEWSVPSSAADRSSKMKTKNWPLPLAMGSLLIT